MYSPRSYVTRYNHLILYLTSVQLYNTITLTFNKGGDEMKGRGKRVAETLEKVSIPVTEDGYIEFKKLAADKQTSMGRLVVEALEEKFGLKLLPEELREAK
jgi:hypothetical protein